MKLYDASGPNPKVVRMFIAEKGLEIPVVPVDMMNNENRGPEHLKRNPSGQLPTLELDDGTCLSEVTAICEYLEELHPHPSLIGTTPEERGQTRMWARKVDLNICEPMTNGFRFSEALDFFESRIHCEPEIAAGLKRLTKANLQWLDAQLAGKAWLVGDRFTLGDILLYGVTSFFAKRGQPLDPSAQNVTAWFERVRARPSARA